MYHALFFAKAASAESTRHRRCCLTTRADAFYLCCSLAHRLRRHRLQEEAKKKAEETAVETKLEAMAAQLATVTASLERLLQESNSSASRPQQQQRGRTAGAAAPK